MQIYLSIDDTDNLDSPGSGQLAEILANKLEQEGLVSQCSNISRHQLFVDAAIPYTSHNSAMCFSATTLDKQLDNIIKFAGQFLRTSSAQGSDPGLCVAVADTLLNRGALIAFGIKAKTTVLDKKEARLQASETGVHLSELGGTGDGIIGALAGVGLRLQGNDGRFRGWLNLGECGEIVTTQSLCAHPWVDAVVDQNGHPLADKTPVMLSDTRIKTVLCNHRQVIPVTPTKGDCCAGWATLTQIATKRY